MSDSENESKNMKDIFGEDDSDDSADDVKAPSASKPRQAEQSGLFDSDDDSDEDDKRKGRLGKRKTSDAGKKNPKMSDMTSSSDHEEEQVSKKLKSSKKDMRKKDNAVEKRKKALEKTLKKKQQEVKMSEPEVEIKAPVAHNSGDEYESDKDIAETKEDKDFIDDDDDLKDVLDEYSGDKQEFNDSRPSGNYSDDDEDDSKGSFFDKTLKSMKSGRRRGDKLQISTEEQIELTREILHLTEEAWDKDQEAISEGKPGFHKVKLLPKLLNVLSKVLMQPMLLEYDFLGIIKRWLQPNDKGELPNLSIRTKLLLAIDKLPIDKDHLKTSGFGKVIMLLWKHPKEVKENKEVCQRMIERWSRDVFEKTTDYKKLADIDQDEYRPRRRNSRSNDQIAAINSGTSQGSERVRIPQPMAFDFVRRPQYKVLDDEKRSSKPHPDSSKGKLMKRMQNIARPARKNVRAINLSVEGRGLQ